MEDLSQTALSMRTVQQSDRLYKLDNLKGILAILVVLGHIINDNTNETAPAYRAMFLFIYSFHMPLFLFIAGYFHKNENIRQKIFYYCILNTLLRVMIFVIKSLCTGTFGRFSFANTDSCAWYLLAMAAYIGLTYLLRDQNPVFVLAISLVISCFAGYDEDIGDVLSLSRIIVFYPYYWTGYCCGQKKLLQPHQKRDTIKVAQICIQILSVIVLAIWALVCIFDLDDVYELRPYFTGRHPYKATDAASLTGAATRLSCYVLTTLVGVALLCLMPEKKIPLLSNMGRYSLSIYFWHRPILYILEKLGVWEFFYTTSHGWIGCICLAVLLSVLLGTRICYRPLGALKTCIFGKSKQQNTVQCTKSVAVKEVHTHE